MKLLKKVFFIELGTFLFAIAVGLFLLPCDILTGGVAGITTLLSPFVSIADDTLVSIISIFLFVIGSIFLGKEFIATTLIHAITYPIMLMLINRYLPIYEIEPILAAIYGGVIGGIGLGVIFRQGGSSGGTDVIPLIVEKYFKIKVSKTIMAMDAITVLLGLYIYGLNSVLIGLISVYLTTFTLERTVELYGGIEAKKFEIISDYYSQIANDIHNELNRGTTIIEATGGFTGNNKKVLMVVVPDEQYSDVKNIIDKYDKNAFVIVSETKDVNGEGFTYEPRI